MKVGDVVRVRWPKQDTKKSLGIIMDLDSNVLIGQDRVLIMMYHFDGKEASMWFPESRLERVA
jgi:hypothetical protein